MKIQTLLIAFICMNLMISEAKPTLFTGFRTHDRNTQAIDKMIKKIQPDLKSENRKRIAISLYNVAKKYNVDPKIMIAIIATESDFSNTKVSTTGDLSLAQINTTVWNKEFTRLGFEKLNDARLKKDEVYALNKMAQILTILKTRHAKKDKNWFARYHSHTKKYKNQYHAKVQLRMNLIASIH